MALSGLYSLLGGVKGASFLGCGAQAVMGAARWAHAAPAARPIAATAPAARTALRMRMKFLPDFWPYFCGVLVRRRGPSSAHMCRSWVPAFAGTQLRHIWALD